MYSMTRKGRPRHSPTLWIVTTCGWVMAAAACASRVNRRRAVASADHCGASSLIATNRFSAASKARKTTPIPPRPTQSISS